VIWDKAAAMEYFSLMTQLGVEIGLAKSIISKTGSALEFAKKTFWNGVDVSPISLSEYSASLMTSAAFVEFVRKYNPLDSFVKSVLGIGYKSNLNTNKK